MCPGKQCSRMRWLQRKMSFQSNRDSYNAIQLMTLLGHYSSRESNFCLHIGDGCLMFTLVSHPQLTPFDGHNRTLFLAVMHDWSFVGMLVMLF